MRRKLAPEATRSLFDPAYRKHNGVFCNLPYYLALRSAEDRPDEFHFTEDEAAIFSHVMDHEVALYERRGWMIGPLTLKSGSDAAVNLSTVGAAVQIPAFVERDALEFVSSDAEGVLLVESQFMFDRLVEQRTWSTANMVLVTGCGIPRLFTRRLLRRLSIELKLPIYLLTDNDTWGYFIFSVLKRGVLGPHLSSDFARVDDLRFIGLRAGDFRLLTPLVATRPWKRVWNARLKHMRSYNCFMSAKWEQELDQFKKQRAAVDLSAFYNALGPQRFTNEYLAERIRTKSWLQ